MNPVTISIICMAFFWLLLWIVLEGPVADWERQREEREHLKRLFREYQERMRKENDNTEN